MPSQKKINLVTKLAEKAGRAKSLVFTNYQGLTHKQLEGLKKALKGVDAELVVTKNTLLKLALGPLTLKLETLNLEGPTATLFSYSNPLPALKELARTIKSLKLPTIKFGILEGQALTGEEVLTLATLPPRELLLAQLFGQIKTPIYGLHRALNWNIQRLTLMLKAIEKTKGGDKNERPEVN